MYVNESGAYVTGSLEYETIWAFGGMLGIADPDFVAAMDFICDDTGLDAMNTGVALAASMDSGYASFGDKEAAINMVEEIARGSEFGKILGGRP